MKIAQVEAIPIKQELKEPFGNAQGWTTARQYLIVKITADDGTIGYGECWGPIAGLMGVTGQFKISTVIAGTGYNGSSWAMCALEQTAAA